MDAGLLSNRIAFYSYGKVADGYGGYTAPTPTLITTIWGFVTYVDGNYTSEDGKRRQSNGVDLVIRKKDFDLVGVDEYTFTIDGSDHYRINNVYESTIDEYVTIQATND